MSPSQLPDDLWAIYDAEVDNVVSSLRRLGARGADLEDLAQEVFVRAFQQLATFDRRRPLRPWLFGIAYRVMSEARRGGWRVRTIEDDDESEPIDPAAGPERVAEMKQARRLVLELLEELPPERRAVFILYELNGESMTDIARALEIPLFTAYSRLRVARAQFGALVRKRRARTGEEGST